MAVVVKQESAGFIYIDHKEVPLGQVIMNYQLNPVTEIYDISIRSTGGNFAWMSNVPLNTIETDANVTFANIGAWLTYWDGLLKGASPISGDAASSLNQPLYKEAIFTLTRPDNSTVYSDGDAILDVVGIATQKFAAVAKSAGRGVCFTNMMAVTNDTGLAGKTIKVVFYTDTPASPIADNSAFSYGTANNAIRRGTVSLTFGTGIEASIAKIGIDSDSGFLNEILCPVATDVYVQVWLPVGYTPSANSTTIMFKSIVIQN